MLIIAAAAINIYVCNDIHDAIRYADLIILAVPVGSMKSVAIEIAPSLKNGCVITDTGSTKTSVINDKIEALHNSFELKNYLLDTNQLTGFLVLLL